MKRLFQQQIGGVYVKSLMIGSNIGEVNKMMALVEQMNNP